METVTNLSPVMNVAKAALSLEILPAQIPINSVLTPRAVTTLKLSLLIVLIIMSGLFLSAFQAAVPQQQ